MTAPLERWTTDHKVRSIGECSHPVIDLVQNSVSGMIFQFVEKILRLTMPSESSMIFSIHDLTPREGRMFSYSQFETEARAIWQYLLTTCNISSLMFAEGKNKTCMHTKKRTHACMAMDSKKRCSCLKV